MTSTLPTPYDRAVLGSGPGLLLAHGAGGGVEANFGPIIKDLAAHHTVVGVDYPGSGRTPVPASDGPARLELDVLADQLVAAADAEGLDTFALCGYSLGGAVAIRAAARHPDRVTALVLTATFAHLDTRTDLAVAIWHQLAESGQHLLLAQFLAHQTVSPSLLNTFTAGQIAAAARQNAVAMPPGSGAQADLVRRVDVRGDLAAITAPALVVVTTADPLIPADLQRQVAVGIPGAATVDLATGHLPFLEQPQLWQETIAGFLADTGRRAPASRRSA